MIIACIYLVVLIMVPQTWMGPFVGIPFDYIVLPLWVLVLFLKGRLIVNKVITQDWFLVLFVTSVAISMLANGTLFLQNRDMGYIVLYYLRLAIIYYMVTCSLLSMQDVKRFLLVFIGLSLILSVEGIQHKLTGVGWAGQRLGWIDPEIIAAGGTGRTRWIGIFDGPGVFCVIYTIALPFVLAGTNKVFSMGVRIVSWAAFLLLMVAIYFNGSRGGLLTTVAILVIYFGRNFKRSKVSVGLGILIGVAILLLAPSYMTEVNDASKSTYHRIEMWTEGLEMFMQNLFFGIGRGNFRDYTGSLVAHNSGVEIMGETGFAGLFMWIGLISLALRNILLYVKETVTEQERMIAIALFIALVGYLVSSMFVTLEYETFYILLALAGVLGRQLKKQPEFARRHIKYLVFASLGWVAFVYFFVNLYKLRYY